MQKNTICTNNYLIRQLPDVIVFLNKDMEIVYASDKLSTEFELKDVSVIGKQFFDVFPFLNQKCQEKISSSSITGESYSTRKEYFFNDEEKWVEWTSSPWYNENENIIGVILKIENIDETANVELKLKKVETLLNETSEAVKIGTWEYSIKDEHLAWSEMTKKIHEVPLDYIPDINNAINFYKKGKNRTIIKNTVEAALKNGEAWNKKLQIITAKNAEKWVMASGKPIYKDNKITGLFGTFHDINNFVLSEIKTKENHKLLRTLIDNLPLCVFVKDLESRKIIANKADVISCGFKTEEELIGKDDFGIFSKEHATSMREEDYAVMSTGIPLLAKENIMTRVNGITNTALTYKIPLKDANGKTKGLVGFSLDITNIKKKEKELRNLIKVTSLQNERLINFAHIVSHNLRSQTANFSMLLDFLIKETDEIEKKTITNMLISTSNKLSETLHNLNDVLIINSNVNIERKIIYLNNKISSIEKNLFPLLNSNKAKIINKVPKDISVNIPEIYLNDILKNILTNSIKYKHPDRDPIIELSIEKTKNYTILSITDNGIGIDLKKHGSKIFGMHKTFHTNKDTKGVGLYIIKNQIEAMNGKITVLSAIDQGSTFNIYFNEKN